MSSTKEVLNNYLIFPALWFIEFYISFISELNADYIPFENNFDVLTCSFQMLGQCSFNPLHPNISLQVLHTVFYAFLTYKENLFNNQEFLEFAINSFIDVILVFRSGGILLGEVRCFSLLVIKRQKKFDDLPLVKLVHWRLEN